MFYTFSFKPNNPPKHTLTHTHLTTNAFQTTPEGQPDGHCPPTTVADRAAREFCRLLGTSI